MTIESNKYQPPDDRLSNDDFDDLGSRCCHDAIVSCVNAERLKKIYVYTLKKTKQNKTKQKPKKRYGRLKKKIKQRSRCGRKKRIKKNYTKNKQINKIRHSDRTEKRLRLGCFVDAERINGCAADTHRKPVDVNVKISVVLYDER